MAKKKKVSKSPSEEPLSFEESLERLDEIVHDLEEGQLGLDNSLGRYEEGVGYLKACHKALQSAERKIELLSGVDAAGNPITEDFEEEKQSLQEKAATRSRRRSRPKNSSSGGKDKGVDEPRGLF